MKSFVINTHHLSRGVPGIFCGRKLSRPARPTGARAGNSGDRRRDQECRIHPCGRSLFISYSGDLLTDLELAPLLEEHFRAGNDVTIALRETQHGTDVALEGNRVVDIVNRYGRRGALRFCRNCSLDARAIFDADSRPASTLSYIPILADWIGQGGRIGGVVLNERKWFNIGSREEYLAAHRTILEEHWRPRLLGAG